MYQSKSSLDSTNFASFVGDAESSSIPDGDKRTFINHGHDWMSLAESENRKGNATKMGRDRVYCRLLCQSTKMPSSMPA